MREKRDDRNSRGESIARARWPILVAALLALAPGAPAQEPEQKGVDQGNYNVKQAIEFGGRVTSLSGNQNTYDTFVNLQQGARLLSFSTEIQSLNHHGTMIDRLSMASSGYGGDPEDVSTLRMSKFNWYSFDAMFRRGQNFWDYTLQANPLNPTTPFVNGPAGFAPPVCSSCVISSSPHRFSTRRKIGNYDLLLRPNAGVRFRLGYARSTLAGPSYSTMHQGTEQVVFQDYKTTTDTYRVGVDVRVLPKTNISYSQLWNFYKGDTGYADRNQNFQLTPTQLVDLGIAFNAAANQPCGSTFLATGFVNPSCSAYITYSSHGRTRTRTPTEQISLQSSYFRNLELTGRFTYSSGQTHVYDYFETLAGRESRTNLRNSNTTGPVFGKRTAMTADFGGTWHFLDKWSVTDSFHQSNWRSPAEFDAAVCSFYSANLLTNANVFTPAAPVPLVCAPPLNTALGTPVHSTSSGADLALDVTSQFLKQDEKTNLLELEYQLSPKLGLRTGYRYRHRTIVEGDYDSLRALYFPGNANRGFCALQSGSLPAGCTDIGGGAFQFITPGPELDLTSKQIDEHSGAFGIWARPVVNLRVSFDAEIMSANGVFTRISPRQSQRYRVRAKYQAANWLNLRGNVAIFESRNNVFETNDLQHNRAFGFSAMLQPNERFGVELDYEYNDVFSRVLICYVSVVTGQPAPSLEACPGVPGLVQQLSTYKNGSHFGGIDFTITPVKRVTAHFGANLTGTSGSELRLDPQALVPINVTGPLDSKYLHPYGGIDYRLAKNWTGKAYWDYYGYHEDPTAGAVIDVYAPRNFRGNLVTLSVRYAF